MHDLFGPHANNGTYDAGDKLAQPYQDDNWYDDLQDTSGLGTSPDAVLFSTLSPAT